MLGAAQPRREWGIAVSQEEKEGAAFTRAVPHGLCVPAERQPVVQAAPTGTAPRLFCLTGGKQRHWSQLAPTPNAAEYTASFTLSQLRAETFWKAIRHHSLHPQTTLIWEESHASKSCHDGMDLGLVYGWVNKEWLCFRQRLFCWQEGGHSQVQQLFWGGIGSSCYRRQHWEKNLWNVQLLNQQLYLVYIQLDRITLLI